MPYDKVENLPSDNIEISENEKIILNNLYPEENVSVKIVQKEPISSDVNIKPQVDSVVQLEKLDMYDTPKEKNNIITEIQLEEPNNFQRSSYLQIVTLVTIFIFLNYPTVTKYINGLYPGYDILIKICIFTVLLILLKYLNFL